MIMETLMQPKTHRCVGRFYGPERQTGAWASSERGWVHRVSVGAAQHRRAKWVKVCVLTDRGSHEAERPAVAKAVTWPSTSAST